MKTLKMGFLSVTFLANGHSDLHVAVMKVKLLFWLSKLYK